MKKFYDCGIDLGTTNSCVAVPNYDNTCTIIENITDRMLVTPSVVWIRGKRTVIGQRAYTCTNVKEVKKEFKRDMGTETVYEFDGSGKTMTPVELSSEILKSLRRDAEQRTNREMQDVVVTVPAAFNMVQCEATKKAAEIAGFRNIVLLQEPIAAAIAYGAQPDAKDQYWMVFDYGGGTLDVSIISTNDGRLDNITSKGNNHMGGKDLDKILFERVILPKLKKEYDLKEGLDDINLAKLMIDVEQCKMELSNQSIGYFETFSAVDNSGNLIDGTYEISRIEFEAAIYDEVHKAVGIAREALTDSGVKENKVDKIILVGGSTCVPLVRKLLQEEFAIDLDSSLNPMTVVCEGAALFAASFTVEEEIKIEEGNDNAFLLDLEYAPMTSSNKINVIGRILETDGRVSKVKIDCITDENSESALWTSGWCEMLDTFHGIFDIDVHICNFEGKNIYRVSAASSDGSNVDLIGYIFEVLYKETSLILSAPPLPHSIGIMVTDGKDNYIDWVFEKDTKLPVRSQPIPYLLNKTLNPNEDTEFNIFIYEGDDQYNPHANDLIRKVHIRSKELTRTIEKGTTVEITIAIDENRCGSITGYVPLYDYELLEESLSNSEENYKNYRAEMELVESKMDETQYTLNMLRKKRIDVKDLETEYNLVKSDFDKYYNLIDVANDEVHQYIQSFYKMQTKVIMKERESREEIQKQNDDAEMRRMDENISTYGTVDQKDAYQNLRRQYDAAKDPDRKQFLISKMDSLETDVVVNNFDWLKMIFLANYASSTSYTNRPKAEYWKSEGKKAIQNEDTIKLSEAINKLYSLLQRSVSESVNVTLADLKKI